MTRKHMSIDERYVQAWVKSCGEHQYRDGTAVRIPSPPIRCEDGFEFSVQAGKDNYCTPRDNYAENYTHFEVGYPTQHEESLAPYASDPEHSPGIYGWVPLAVIMYLIEKHGGIHGGSARGDWSLRYVSPMEGA